MEMNIINAEDGIGMNVQTGGGSGGTKDHSKLQNLDYEHSGHTGFAANYIVELTKENDEITSNKTINEIIEAYKKDYIVKGILTDTEAGVDFNLQLLIAFEDSDFGLVQFATVYDSGDDFKSITIIGTLENNEDSWQYLDKEIVSDSDYVHTDNNYTTNEKNKLAGLENKIITINADPQTMQLDKSADEIENYLNNGYIVMALGYQVFRKDYDASTHTIQLAIYFGAFGQVITVVGNQVTNVNEYYYANDYNYVHTDNNFSYYYKDKLDNAPEIVDLSSYQVGDTISDTTLIAKLMNDGCKIKYGNTIYSYARLDNSIVRLYTVMADVDHGEYIALIVQGNDTLLLYEINNAYWEMPSNRVQNLDNPTTETYPSTLAVYNALQNVGGGSAFYLGNVSDYTQQNPLDLDKLELGLYAFTPAGSSNTIYAKATNNGQNVIGTLTANGSDTPRILYLKITNKVKDMTLTTSFQTFGYFYIDSFNESDKRLEYKSQGVVAYLSNNTPYVASNSSASKTTFNLVTTGGTQTITAKKTFSVLPESSVVPTSDNQLVNKKYVDDNAGGGDVSYVIYTNGGTFFNKNAVTLTTGTGTSHLNYNIIPNICSYLSILRNKFGANTQVYLEAYFGSNTKFYASPTLKDNLYLSGTLVQYNLKNDFDTSANGYFTWNSTTSQYENSRSYADAKRQTDFIPMTNNTLSYTPSGDYNPATKKYVDDKPTTYTGYDATKTQVLKNINGTLTWVDE